MKRFRTWLTLWGIGFAAVLTALVLTGATYAWFASNREVETARVTARTGSEELELQISTAGGAAFTPMKDASGERGEATLKELDAPLLPVSTANLAGFVYCPVTVDGNAEQFLPTTDETMYYHDTIYLRAVAQGLPEGTRVALYLDDDETQPIVQAEPADLLTAARLGLTFNGENPVIFTLSDVNEGTGNTRPGGVPLGAGQVLTWQNGAAVPANDPAISLSAAQYAPNGATDNKPLTYLTLNEIYAVDVYFYLEGCDPDCLSQRVERDQAVLYLAFYGLLAE